MADLLGRQRHGVEFGRDRAKMRGHRVYLQIEEWRAPIAGSTGAALRVDGGTVNRNM